MKIDEAQAALSFLGRAQLQGQEVGAYLAVQEALRKIAEGQIICKPAPKKEPDGEE